MGKNARTDTVELDLLLADWPDAVRQGQKFYHGAGLSGPLLESLRAKGYTPVDFRNLDGEERIQAMLEATQNGLYDPTPGQVKVIDLHIKALKDKKPEENDNRRGEVADFLDLLADFTSKTRPEWAKVGVEPTSAPKISSEVAPAAIADIMGDIF
jgi:hypothetical protein